jgi:hypothetical protein
MKALSLYQPWAWLMVNGHKDVENRSWKDSNPGLKFRGTCLVHASRTFDEDAYAFVGARFPELRRQMPARSGLPMGGIVGEFEIYDSVTECASPWFFGPKGLLVRNARPLRFVPMLGSLGFFNVSEDIVREARAA